MFAFCPNGAWLQSMRRAMTDKPGAALWRWAAVDQLTRENLLTGNLFYTCEEGPLPLLKPPAAAPANHPMPERATGKEGG